MDIIQFKDVWEMYRIKFIIDGKVSRDNFWALKDVTFKVKKGECLGIIGENGSGKTTILRLMAGMIKPDRGKINLSGRVSGLLELGAGFEPELTGRENIYLSGSLFGLSKGQIEEKYKEIADFASLGRFINAPVKCYSQGMYVRLAFSVAIHMDPDILLIDDILAVGDEYFQGKCIKRIFELKERGATIIVVSHDMNTLKRLCARAILLKEGRIVKDGAIEDVIPLYSQMVGAKEGVGVLGKEPISLIFNNGRAFLSWKEKLLTPHYGMYTVLRIGDKWYSSTQASWEVKKEGEESIIATGEFYQLGLTQVWRIKRNADRVILWDVEIKSQQPLDIQEGCLNIMLTDEYKRWFSSLERGTFPVIDKEERGQGLLLDDNSLRSSVGVEGRRFFGGEIPTLALENPDYVLRNRAQILNSDYLTNCRILQYKVYNLSGFSTAGTGNFRCFSGKIVFDIPDIDKYLRELEDRFSLSCGKLKWVFQNGQSILFYNNIRLTEGLNASTSIHVNKRWYYSHLARWEIKKEGPKRLIVKGSWPNLGLTQTWEVELTGEKTFLWEVYLDLEQELEVEEARAEIASSKDYSRWFSEYGSGVFPEEFLDTETDMLQRCIPDGLVGVESEDSHFPLLRLEFTKGPNKFAKIFNSDFYHRARILRIDRVEPEGKIRFRPGRHKLFSIRSKVDGDGHQDLKEARALIQNSGLKAQAALRAGGLKFIFDKGSGRICMKEVELTKGLGLYTSLRSGGRWHDSYSKAIWKIEKEEEGLINAFGKWLHLPLAQHWTIKLSKEGSLEFKVKMRIDKKIEVERLQVNLMLSERYLEWLAPKARGLFPLFKTDIDDDWHCIWQQKEAAQSIAVAAKCIEKEKMPSVVLSPQGPNKDWHLKIINSDICHRGRVLQYSNSQKQTILPGEYNFFSGSIKTDF